MHCFGCWVFPCRSSFFWFSSGTIETMAEGGRRFGHRCVVVTRGKARPGLIWRDKSHAPIKPVGWSSICELRSRSAEIAFGESEVTLTCTSMPRWSDAAKVP